MLCVISETSADLKFIILTPVLQHKSEHFLTKMTNRNYCMGQLIVCCTFLCFDMRLIDFRSCRMDHQLQE